MRRIPRWLAPVLLAGPLTLAGCLGTSAPPVPAAPGTGASATPPGARSGTASADASKPEVSPLDVTPLPDIDPKKQVDVVREETQGGEASAGPSPFDYLWQPARSAPQDRPMEVEPPLGLPDLTPVVYVPAANPLTTAKFELGKQLYFDPRVSLDGTISCATCHNPEKGWTDQFPQSVGIDGQIGARNAPTVLNTVYGRTMFWDGRAPSLEGQAQGPIQNPIEMGNQSYKEIVGRLRQIPGYQEQFATVFGTEVTLDGLAKAIATFERGAALSGASAYDRYNNGDLDALTESQKRGMVLFGLRPNGGDPYPVDQALLKKAQCTSCHAGFNFTDEQFHNIGVGFDPSTGDLADLGRWAVTPIGAKNDADRGSFKTPTVRDVERTFPYMHDGSLTTLEAVMDHYDKGGIPNAALDKDMKPLNLSSQEKADVVAFMKALTGEAKGVALPTLPPGPDGQSPDPRKALEPPQPRKAALGDVHGILAR